MKKLSVGLIVSLVTMTSLAQSGTGNNTLLWKISGNGLEKPSYLFGTIHMLCADDAVLSKNMKKIIEDCDEVYFEVDMDNLFEMVGAMNKMKMKGDTTLKDLLTEEEYDKVKAYFDFKGSMLPFSMLETYKPMLAASTLQEGAMPCDNTAMMEQVIMQEAKIYKKKINGMETMSYQAGVLDSIPYKLQAQQLLSYIETAGKDSIGDKQMEDMFKAYNNQDLQKLEELMIETDAGMAGFTDILLYHRNQNWVKKLKTLLPQKSILVAVGAGHLPGEKGVINLLRKEGYKVTPVENKLNLNREI
ncbi:MAG: TraB/GumN family protein [Chitinophagaceae bacterium]|nr:TraB/GumN family protein [Chitinophagaceae bacterium]MBK8605750.1 TraB/GumN family protein [Chitinophagaceae bacterium]MBP6478996.1 TraB/GumN family protein [Chitinophagaceae bacterium]MBP7107508.1 TraB/GumN family protein [Chitinophagaceae bacterium]HQX96385.1 TraB/GumN family protein [Chitinophagaceae bacterium]